MWGGDCGKSCRFDGTLALGNIRFQSCNNFFCQLKIRNRADRAYVVDLDGFAKAWGFCQTDVSGDNCPEYAIAKEGSSVCGNLSRKIQAGVVHGEQHALDEQRWV